MTINCVTLIAFIMVKNLYIALVIRFITGFSQVFFSIYSPVWAVAYGSEREKPLWITALTFCSTLGIFIGFSFATVLNTNGEWQWAFIIQASLCVPCIIGLCFTDKMWLNVEES